MPDVSKLNLDGTSYKIKDEDARKHLVVVNSESQPATKVNITTGDDVIELATSEELNKVTAQLKMNDVNTISPVYLGDFISDIDHVPTCCVKIGNYIYAFEPHTADYCRANNTDIGTVRVFDIVNNIELTDSAKNIHIGHANSCCYNPSTDLIYVVPADKYENNTIIPITKIYAYSLDFNTMTEIDTPTLPKSVTYDFVKDKMYYCGRAQDVYVYEDGEWNKVADITVANIDVSVRGSHDYNQDFAVRDGYFYLSGPFGGILFGILETGVSKIIKQYCLESVDTNFVFRLGELEGFEFDEDGHLYTAMFTTLDSYVRDAFIMNIPVGNTPMLATSMYGVYTANIRTVVLSSATQRKFALDRGEIRSLSQLACMTELNGNNVSIPAADVVTEDSIVIIDKNLTLTISGEYRVRRFNLHSGIFTIYADNANSKLTHINNYSDANLIKFLGRSTALIIGGTQTLNVDLGNLTDGASNFVDPGGSNDFIIVKNSPTCVSGQSLYIGSRKVVSYSVLYGSKNLRYYDESAVSIYGGAVGYISNGQKDLYFSVTVPFPFLPNATVSVTSASGIIIVRGINGYVPDNSGINLSNENVSYVCQGNVIHCTVHRTSAFANSANNTPVHVYINNKLVFNLSTTY